MIWQSFLFSYLPTLVGCDSADFDATNDFMARGAGLTGASDSKSGIFSCWIRLDGSDLGLLGIFNLVTTLGGGTGRCNVLRTTGNLLTVNARNAAGTLILSMVSATTYAASATWLHFLTSWDLAATTGHLYVNDAEDQAVGATLTDDTIDYTVADSGVGGLPDATAKFDGCIAELYFAPGQYLDFSTESNRRKFITAGGKPVFLGVDGSLPTGTSPIVYFHTGIDVAITTFATNRGTGGDYSITGTLTTGSTSPSD